jgi:hypothetical protein
MGVWRTGFLWLAGLCLSGLVGCATDPGAGARTGEAAADWAVLEIDQVKRIAEIRESLNEMRVAFRDVLIVRLTMAVPAGEEKRVDVSSIGPTYVGIEKDGAPAARTTFALTEKRERLVLFTQDVPNRRAFLREIPVGELAVGKSYRFPVVQESGRILEHTFTVQQLIVR